MDPEDDEDGPPEGPRQDEDGVRGDSSPDGEQEPEGTKEPEGDPEADGDTTEVGDGAPPAAGRGDRALRNALYGFDFDYFAGLREMINKSLMPNLGAMDALGRQQASWPKTFAVPDFSSVVPKFDLPKYVFPKFDLPVIDFPVLDAATRQMSESVLTGFDFGKFLPKIDFGDLLKFEPPGGWEKWWANWWPPNWPRDIDIDAVQAILNDEALPLVWVPRAAIVIEVLEAETREERVAVLVARRAEVAEDCRTALTDIDHPRLLPQRRLLAAAVDALADGHDEAAQSLAVLVAETAVLQAGAAGHIDGVAKHAKLYERVKDAVRVDLDEAPLWLLRVAGALAPVAGFFTPFYPHRGDPVPEGMSRHVTVHFAFDEHYTEDHAVVAVLLMASVVRGLQQGWEIWEPDEATESDGGAEGV